MAVIMTCQAQINKLRNQFHNFSTFKIYIVLLQLQLFASSYSFINIKILTKLTKMTNTRLTLARLNKEQQSLLKQPMDNALVARQGNLNFHFCIFNLDGDYKNGFYYGMLQLHPNYPFAAPKLFFYTPNGRYQINMAICTSFTSYHQQSWTSAWNVRTLIQGTISFMLCQDGSYGCRNDNSAVRKQYAKDSLTFNYQNPKFVQLFDDQIKKNLSNFIKKGITIYDSNLKKLIGSQNCQKQVQLQVHEKKQTNKQQQQQQIEKEQKQKLKQAQQKEEFFIQNKRQRTPYNLKNDELIENLQKINQYNINQPLLIDQLPFQQDDQNQKNRKIRNKKIKTVVLIGAILLIVGVGAYFGYKNAK